VVAVSEPLADVVKHGDRRASLEAIRDRVALELESAGGRDVAALAKQLTDVIRELDSLPNSERKSAVDDLSSARAARRKKAAGS
jgi:hypothetical protein